MKHIWKQLYPNAWLQLGGLVLALLLGAASTAPELMHQHGALAQLQQDKEALLENVLALEQQHTTAKLELKLEVLSQQETQNALAQQRQQLDQLEKELAFYRSIMAPETIVDGVVVHDFVLDETSEANRFRFGLVLAQQKVRKRYAKGNVQISIDGSLAGQLTSLDLVKLSGMNNLNFSFRYFQQFEGEFVLPDKFIPEQVRVKVVGTSKRAQNETNFLFSELISSLGLLKLRDSIGHAE